LFDGLEKLEKVCFKSAPLVEKCCVVNKVFLKSDGSLAEMNKDLQILYENYEEKYKKKTKENEVKKKQGDRELNQIKPMNPTARELNILRLKYNRALKDLEDKEQLIENLKASNAVLANSLSNQQRNDLLGNYSHMRDRDCDVTLKFEDGNTLDAHKFMLMGEDLKFYIFLSYNSPKQKFFTKLSLFFGPILSLGLKLGPKG
jgi:hypothetical protein